MQKAQCRKNRRKCLFLYSETVFLSELIKWFQVSVKSIWYLSNDEYGELFPACVLEFCFVVLLLAVVVFLLSNAIDS